LIFKGLKLNGRSSRLKAIDRGHPQPILGA
jgi:hypothetical protein